MRNAGSKRARIFHRDGDQCLRCGSEDNLTLDHILPRSQGGTNSVKNLQTLCRGCNADKADRYVDYRIPGQSTKPRKPPRRGMWGLHDAILKALPRKPKKMLIVYDGQRYSATLIYADRLVTTPHVNYDKLKSTVLEMVTERMQ